MTSSRALLLSIVGSTVFGFLAVPCACATDGVDITLSSESDDDEEDSGTVFRDCEAPRCDEHEHVCEMLVERTCGGCPESAACAAATLLSRHEPEGCAAALGDERTYPACTESACAALMDVVCGGVPPTASCAQNPGCAPAQALWERATSPDGTTQEIAAAEASCAAALTDNDVFAPCAP
jgi:hypothetical protein